MIIKNLLTWIISYIILISVSFAIGVHLGKKSLYRDFQSDRCWIKSDTNDVVCIAFIE